MRRLSPGAHSSADIIAVVTHFPFGPFASIEVACGHRVRVEVRRQGWQRTFRGAAGSAMIQFGSLR